MEILVGVLVIIGGVVGILVVGVEMFIGAALLAIDFLVRTSR